MSESGVAFFEKFGVELAAVRSRRWIFCHPCLDWTERRGTVGAAPAQRRFDLKWLRRDSRALIITPVGRRGLSDAFGLSL